VFILGVFYSKFKNRFFTHSNLSKCFINYKYFLITLNSKLQLKACTTKIQVQKRCYVFTNLRINFKFKTFIFNIFLQIPFKFNIRLG